MQSPGFSAHSAFLANNDSVTISAVGLGPVPHAANSGRDKASAAILKFRIFIVVLMVMTMLHNLIKSAKYDYFHR
jgi:hypothetical protein